MVLKLKRGMALMIRSDPQICHKKPSLSPATRSSSISAQYRGLAFCDLSLSESLPATRVLVLQQVAYHHRCLLALVLVDVLAPRYGKSNERMVDLGSICDE